MDKREASAALERLASRLATLSGILDKAEADPAGRALEELAQARLAPDMHPLAWQVSAVCTQALQFLEWSRGHEVPHTVAEVTGWAEARAALAQTRDRLAQALADAGETPEGKRIVLGPLGLYLDLSAPRYLDDWIVPNLYFHLTTAYAILRMQGIALGKADFMAHLMGDLKPIEPELAA
ncbi:DUF1993 domain-containing protein [Novosphingobium album (ex Liu et al. 2023)]|uniref:DUF1993 domain-containing protein n=1 Tax=Novosphingobium album (ex Liu et al. 2023) TaxID=3031130 RepID=A0ABT5WSF8_9SPHN|nr:DUF1993 domain-containing protein [Novosphingobium album (ex Liu et al. 2023)]MDE8652968.1 DUF1993 domain-containing protein [Novosphingobium album (ex Liu et al. 2023)]